MLPLQRTPPRAARGFTLVEILVVVVIIAILSTGFILSVSLTGRDQELEKESDRFFNLLNYAREQAELQTREYGVILEDDNYEFVSYDMRQQIWRSVSEDDILRLRKLPDGLNFKLMIDTRPVVLKKPVDAKDKTPQLMIFSSGDLTQFRVTLEREGGIRSVTIEPDDKGSIVEKPMVDTTATGGRT